MNTATLDQLRAASRDARRLLDEADRHGLTRVDAEPGPFMTGLLAQVARDGRRGRLRSCRHLQGRGPRPSWLLAWRPTRLLCPSCVLEAIAAVRGTRADMTCDACGQVVDRIWASMTAAGPLVVVYGLCRRDFEAETGQVAA